MAIKHKSFTAISLAMSLLAISGVSHASCTGENLVFSCKTKSNKVIRVCKSGDNYTYSYGGTGKKPEMKLTRSKSDVIKQPWNGMGYSYNQSIGFKNGNVTYSVFSSYDRSPKGKSSGGVLVEAKKHITIDCKPKTMTDNIANEVE